MWIAPWRKLEEIIGQISSGEAPRTFLIDGAAEPGCAGGIRTLSRGSKSSIGRSLNEFGTQQFLARWDGLLAVDARRIVLMNLTFEKLFGIRTER
jgi:hypothetical protein